jgi:hypothetical protein
MGWCRAKSRWQISDDPAGKLAVPVHDGLDGEADGFLHPAAHQEDLFLQPGQFLVE